MTDVTFIGLGFMGAALVKTAQEAGYDITIWNRTASKADELVKMGASYVPNIEEAIAASPITIVCLGSYKISVDLLKMDECMRALNGKTVIQLTSGAGRDASAMNKWIMAAGARFVAGGIEAYPEGIGTKDSMFIVAGDEQGYKQAENLLRTLAPILHYMGEDPARAGAMYGAMLAGSFGFIFGVMHAVAICEATGISVKQYLDIVSPVFKTDIDLVTEMSEKCADDNLQETEASLGVWNETLGSIVQTMKDNKLNTEFPSLMHDMLNRAEKAGYDSHDLAAVIKMIRKDQNA